MEFENNTDDCISEQTLSELYEEEDGPGDACGSEVSGCDQNQLSNQSFEEPSPQNKEDSAIKIVVFGKDGTGKSALIVRLLTKRFIHEYDPTSENVYGFECVIDGQNVLLKIMDTAGMVERNIHEREEQIKWGDGYLLVMSLTNSASLDELEIIKALIDEFSERPKPIVLVANKSDLAHAREVSSSDITQIANELNCPAFETAATGDYDLVSEPFFCLYRKIKKCNQNNDLPRLMTTIDSGLILKKMS